MKKGTSQKLLLAAAVVTILNFSSCGKYEDGPSFSLKTKMNRLTQEWEVIKIGNELMDNDTKLYLDFEKDGDFKFKYTYIYNNQPTTYVYTGEWEWDDSKETIEVIIDNTLLEWKVKRLTSNELWFEDKDNDLWKCESK